jgi:hypothetical protein
MTSIAAIVPTYKRRDDLLRCISSLVLSASLTKGLDLSIYICNNDPSCRYEISDFCDSGGNIAINIANRPENIGGRANFYFSLLEAFNAFICDAYVFISDDDFVFPNFFKSLIADIRAGHDALICSCSVIYDPHLNKDGYSIVKSHAYRHVPTRPYLNKKLQFIIDSRLMTGTLYTRSLLSRFFLYAKLSDSNENFICSLWYPMCFLGSFSRSPGFIEHPLFVHSQGNEVFWGDIDYFNEFFLGRIDMYRVVLECGNITQPEFNALITDFVAHQNFLRFAYYVFLSSSPSFAHRVSILSKFILVNLFYRSAYFINALARRLPGLSSYLLRI